MNERTKQLLDRLEQEHALALEEYAELLLNRTQQAAAYAAEKAMQAGRHVYGDAV